MEINKKLCKLFFQFPAICIYGNEGDFSRYKILKKIIIKFDNENYLINKYLRDRINVIVYPQKYGKIMMAIDSEEIYTLEKMDMLTEKKYNWVLIPGDRLLTDEIIILPVSDIEEEVFNIRQAVFVESFPFGKKEFCDLVLEFIKEQKITCSKKIILFDEDFQYGATDISDESVGIEGFIQKMSGVSDDIYLLSDYKENDNKLSIKKQYIEKKRAILEYKIKSFKDGYDREFEFQKQRWLCDEEKKSILSDAAFEEISDYKNVKNSIDIEKKIFNNLLDYLGEKKEDLCKMIKRLYNAYLYELVSISDKQIEKYYDKVISELKNTYKFQTKHKCPDSKLDYRVLCSNGQYVIKLRKYLEKIVDNCLKTSVKSDIETNLRLCEVKYYE